MRKLMRVYAALLRTAWATMLEYRAQAILWILSFVFPLVMMNVWLAVIDEAGPLVGWGRGDFISYYIAATVVNYLTSAWMVWDWDEHIRTGSLSMKLLYPVDPFHQLLNWELGWKLFMLLTLVPLVSMIAWLSPAIDYPLTWDRAMAVGLSVIAGFALNVGMSCAFAMLSFWSTQTNNLFQLWSGLGQFFSGWIAPLALFPEAFRQFASLLPFRYTLSFPLEILMGQLAWPEMASGFLVTGGWGVLFFAAYRALWRLGIRRYEAVGA
jgi:ABC-2 type transport system permease protein